MTAEEYLMGLEWYEDNYLGGSYEWVKEKDLQKLMESYAKMKVLSNLNEIQSYMQGADEDMIYDYIEKLKQL